MDETTRNELAFKVDRFDRAKQKQFRLEKLRAVMQAIDEDEHHTIGAIVIDVFRQELRYIPVEAMNKGIGCSICSLTQDDQVQIFREFVAWAKENIAAKMQHEQAVMDSV